MKQFKPKEGEKYFYVSVPRCWDFRETEVIAAIRKECDNNDSTNCFSTREEAEDIALKIKKLFNIV